MEEWGLNVEEVSEEAGGGGGEGRGAPAEVSEQALSRFLSGSSPQTRALVLSCVGVGAGGGDRSDGAEEEERQVGWSAVACSCQR